MKVSLGFYGSTKTGFYLSVKVGFYRTVKVGFYGNVKAGFDGGVKTGFLWHCESRLWWECESRLLLLCKSGLLWKHDGRLPWECKSPQNSTFMVCFKSTLGDFRLIICHHILMPNACVRMADDFMLNFLWYFQGAAENPEGAEGLPAEAWPVPGPEWETVHRAGAHRGEDCPAYCLWNGQDEGQQQCNG